MSVITHLIQLNLLIILFAKPQLAKAFVTGQHDHHPTKHLPDAIWDTVLDDDQFGSIRGEANHSQLLKDLFLQKELRNDAQEEDEMPIADEFSVFQPG